MKKLIIALMLIVPCLSFAEAYVNIPSESLNAFQAFLWQNNARIDGIVPSNDRTVFVQFHTENASREQNERIVTLLMKLGYL